MSFRAELAAAVVIENELLVLPEVHLYLHLQSISDALGYLHALVMPLLRKYGSCDLFLGSQ
jgi:hypothetical protein